MNRDYQQTTFDFGKDLRVENWPDQQSFPLNLRDQLRKVSSVINRDLEDSENFLIITGFTSLSNLIDTFGTGRFPNLEEVRIVLGFEPNIRGRKKYDTAINLSKEIKEYWINRGLSVMQGGAVIHLIELIKEEKIRFRYKDKLHAKIYIGDRSATMGSSNFSKSGLEIQDEANMRVRLFETDDNESKQYDALKLIAENFHTRALDYDKEMIALLENLIQQVTWQEALARAIAEVVEGEWLNEYRDLYAKIEKVKLWPTQWRGIAQAMNIIQRQSNVLIADPTGSGKTKFCTALILIMTHWLWENGKRTQSNSMIICPPLVIPNWSREFKDFGRANHNQISMGILSQPGRKSMSDAIEEIELSNILVIDEAHNYLNPESNRSKAIKRSRAEHTILATATPINKRADDLLRLIELLDVDNLSDQDFETYKRLKERKSRQVDADDLNSLKRFISQFTVRRTKSQLNKEISKEKERYVNREGNPCKFPEQHCLTYKTKETAGDITIVKQISELLRNLHGVIFLRRFSHPEFELKNRDAETDFINMRISAGRALAGYMIRAALRSSHAAVIEHIKGPSAAAQHFDFVTKKTGTGNFVEKIERFRSILPDTKSFDKSCYPDWLIDQKLYREVCNEEIDTYEKIGALAKRLSGKRELGKVQHLLELQKKHKLIVAFDSTVITLDYLKSLFDKQKTDSRVFVVTGSDSSDKEKDRVIKDFALGSKAEDCIALCSDKMSEGVNLQQASAVALLDMPSVLRIVEQRIGRIDRMDSPHLEIDAYWPEDSEEYSLKGDKRLIDTSILTENIIGSNLSIPKELRDRHFKDTDHVKGMIKEYKNYDNDEIKWEGIHDSFKPIQDLKEGANPLIPEMTYEKIRNVNSTIKTRVSFISSGSSWAFFALRGNKYQSPKWYLIDPNENIHTDYRDICSQLREFLSGNNERLEWSQGVLEKFVKKLHEKERHLLPEKKRRALDVAEYILEKKLNKEKDSESRILINQLLSLFKFPDKDFIVDFDGFADQWINFLQPFLDKKREQAKRKRAVYNLDSLKREYLSIPLDREDLKQILESCPYTENIDSKIAACIIGVGAD